jgi:SH3-like domain-containing protein
VRFGPTREHDVSFVYHKAGLPVEITGEHDTWRRIRDWEGSEGWVQMSLLTAQKRAVMVTPSKQTILPVYENAYLSGKIVATLEGKVTATAKSCTLKACLVSGVGFEGWIDQSKLWGVYPNEKF